MKAVAIAHPEAATALDAGRLVPAIFPAAGTYEVRGPDGGARTIEFSDAPALAADPLSIFQAVFAKAGTYLVKAEGARSDQWYMETLLAEAMRTSTSLREGMLRVMLDLVRRYGGDLTDPGVIEQLERALMDCRLAVRWSLAHPLPPAVEARLRAAGFSDQDVLDWPGLAYRFGLIEAELAELAPGFSWDHVLTLARRVPLLPGDQEAIDYAREKVAQHLTPLLARDPQRLVAEALDRERAMVRTMTASAVRREIGAPEFARELYRALNADTTWRDYDRLARTELHDARLHGAFVAEERAKGWGPDTLVYRSLSAKPCNACLTLYKQPDGRPRLYTVAQVREGEAQGPNRGPWQDWHIRVGPTHPNCLDSPWLTYRPELSGLFAREAPMWHETFKRRGLLG